MQKTSDISPVLALLLLGLVIGGLWGAQNYEILSRNWDLVLISINTAKEPLAILFVSLLFNASVFIMHLERLIGYKKQGSKLRSIKKDKDELKLSIARYICSLACVFAAYLLINSAVSSSLLPLKILLNDKHAYLVSVHLISSALTLFFVIYWLLGFVNIFAKIISGNKLGRFKMIENHLTLGSVGEELSNFEEEIKPKWSLIPQKALNGNILVTGSIGTGKTQGTILNYAEQLFGTNFHLTPSSLVLDPKGSFIPEVVKILEKYNSLGNCIYLGDADANI